MNLLLVIFGFSLIICIHELGHFLAARWAGIRVLAFAVGFGSALVSWRQGLGLRLGSSETDYLARREREGAACALSPTEYRLNYLPFGGYVKMLGQEDLDPTAVSDEPDSYQRCKTWKRMVVISAGVVMNLIAGAILFVIVFMAGLQTEPPWVGDVGPGSPAARARALNAGQLGVTTPGLQGGDRILEIDDRVPRSFNDIILASAMAGRDETLRMRVQRPGVPDPLVFEIAPEMNVVSRLREIGIGQARSTTLFDPEQADIRELLRERLAAQGWEGVEPGMTLVRVDSNDNVASPAAILRAVRDSGGRPVEAEFRGGGRSAVVEIEPVPEYQNDLVLLEPGRHVTLEHLLGLTPLIKVGQTQERGEAQGLRAGDIFLRIGDLPYPSVPRGVVEIRRHKGRTIDLLVLRGAGTAAERKVPLTVEVSGEGAIGFLIGEAEELPIVALSPKELRGFSGDAPPRAPPATTLIDAAGTRILAVAGTPVVDFAELRAALLAATAAAHERREPSTRIEIELLEPPGEDPATAERERRREWTLSAADLERLHGLRWTASGGLGLFRPEQMVLRAETPLEAVRMGLGETRRTVLMTYVTFARLFQGTVKVEHLKGPIGIAHLGTLVADRGMIWLLFFMGMISINLAVINFLPMPIVDGGQFLFLLVEQIRGRPVSVKVQNATTLAGLVLIGSIFLVITYNDIVGLFAGR